MGGEEGYGYDLDAGFDTDRPDPDLLVAAVNGEDLRTGRCFVFLASGFPPPPPPPPPRGGPFLGRPRRPPFTLGQHVIDTRTRPKPRVGTRSIGDEASGDDHHDPDPVGGCDDDQGATRSSCPFLYICD